MSELILLTDGSVNPQSKLGYGAYLLVTDPDLSLAKLSAQVKLRRFEPTSSTKLELQTLLWALSEIPDSGLKLKIYTDSQNIIGLAQRREQLKQKKYRSSSNRLLNNYQLYQEFYRLTDQFNCELIQLHGHRPAQQKDSIDRLFTLVDRASRRALRAEMC